MVASHMKDLRVFYCYARADQKLREQLEDHLSNLKRLYHLKTWFDRQINPGENWEEILEENLNTADLILLLISPAFMASDYCYNKEMQRALERHTNGEAKVIPILLRPVHWKNAPFSSIQILPTNARPITRWSDRNDAFYDVTLGIEEVIQSLLSSHEINKGNKNNGSDHILKILQECKRLIISIQSILQQRVDDQIFESDFLLLEARQIEKQLKLIAEIYPKIVILFFKEDISEARPDYDATYSYVLEAVGSMRLIMDIISSSINLDYLQNIYTIYPEVSESLSKALKSFDTILTTQEILL